MINTGRKLTILILFLVTGILLNQGASLAKSADQPSSNKTSDSQARSKQAMKDFVVSGEDKLKVRSEKLLRVLFVDADKPIQEIMAESAELSEKIMPDKQLASYERAAVASDSRLTFSPWLNLITKQPVLAVRPQMSKNMSDLKSWKFVISDETGQELFSQKGGSRLPAQFIWDGSVRGGGLINVGESYFYSITLTDRAGNPYFTNSKPRKLRTLAYYENNRLHLSLQSSLIFDKKIRSSLSEIGQSVLTEGCDYLIKDLGRKTLIMVHTVSPKLGQAQGEKVKKFIVDKLAIPKQDIEVKTMAINQPFLERVDIECLR